jgi:hypothetical protein
MHRYALGQRSMAPLVEAASNFNIATNPHPAALYEASPGGLQLWCTPDDNPGDLWNSVHMVKGVFAKPCAFVGGMLWQCSRGGDPVVLHLLLTTIAYALCEENLVKLDAIHNRPDDIAWARQKLSWLWQASVASQEMPPIVVRH